MADRKYSLGIVAETGQAKKAISELQRSIENLSKVQISTNYLDKGINDAVAAAKELEYHLGAALNQNTGKLNLNTFTQSLADSNTSAKDLMQTLLQGGAAGQQTFTSLANAIAQSEVPLRRANKTLQDFATTLKNTVKWEISSTMVHSLESALSGAVSYAKNLNTSLTNIRIVTGQSVDDMARFAKEANIAAKALSTTTKSYADASLIYYQQGDSQEMAAKKAAITIKAANASFETSAKEMSEYLTSVWNSYQVGADELERYVDIMANLGAKTATSLEEIATSMQKVAATSNTVGVSMEQVSSIIATVSSVTRESAESIGTSYKTIFARIGDLKLGKVDEDGVGLGQVSSQLDAIGVRILDESGNLREMGDIITDLGTKWQTMNQAQKTAVAQVVAGKRQYTQLMALFENWDMYQQNMNIAQNSEGALQGMADTYAESWEAASARVQASLEGIYGQILNDQAIIKLTDGLATFISGIDTLIERLGGIKGTLATLGGIGINVFSKQIAGGINKTIGSVTTFVSQFRGIKDFWNKASSNQIQSNEQIEYGKRQKEWQDAIKQVKVVEGENSAQQVALENSQNLLNLKQQLIDAEYSLTDAQKARASAILTQLSAEQDQILTLMQQKEQLAMQEKQNATASKSNILSTLAREKYKGNVGEARQAEGQIVEGRIQRYSAAVTAEAFLSTAGSKLTQAKGTGDPKYIEQTIKNIKQILSSNVEDNFLIDLDDNVIDFTQNIETIIKKLEELRQRAEQAGDAIESTMNRNTENSPNTRKAYADAFAQAATDAGNKADNAYLLSGAQSNIEIWSKKFRDFFDKDSQSMKTLGDNLQKAAGTMTSMVGGFEAGASAVAVLNDETATLGDHLAAATGIVTNLASGFASGGIWGLVLTGATMAISAAIQYAEEQKKKYQDKQTEEFEKSVKESEEKDAELSNIQALMKNYNTLKETYDTTGEGQDALAASARALAEAYGLVGANVLIAEGNFKQFESLIARSSGLDVLSSFYQEKIDEATAEVYNKDKKSKYYDEGWLNDSRYLIETQYDAEGKVIGHAGQYTRDYYNQDEAQFSKEQLSELIPNPEELIGDYHQDTIAAAKQALLDSDDLFNQWDSMTNLVSDAREKGLGNLWVDGFTTSLGKHDYNLRDDIISLNPETYQNTLMSELYKYFDPEIFDMFQGNYEDDEAPSHLLAKFESMIQENEDGSLYIRESQLDEFLKATKKLKLQWLKDFADWGQEKVNELGEKFLESDSSAKTEYDAAIAERQRAIEAAKEGQEQAYIDEAYSQYAEIIGGPTDQNYFDTLVNEEGLLSYNDEGVDKVAWYQNYLRQKEAVHAEQEKIEQALASDSVKEGSLLHTILTNRLETVKLMAEDLDSLEDKDLTALVKQIGSYEESAAKVKLINEAMADLIGKSEANTGFDTFSDAMDKIKSGIDASAKSYEELQKYLIVDETSATGYAMNEDGTYKVKEDLQDSYNAVRDQIAAGFITDFTSFDDFLSIYQDLAAIFTGDKFNAVKNYINTAGIKDARLVNSRLINSMKQDLQGDSLSISEDTNEVLQFNKQELAAKDSIQAYKDFDKLASSYKDDLSYDEALALQQSLLKDGDIEWKAFVNMDADARKTYLESRKEASMAAAKLAQEQLAAAAREQQEQLYVTEEDYKKDKALVDTFFNDYEKTEDGRYALKGHEGVYAATSYAERMEAMQTKTQDYESLGQVAEDADAAVAAFELLDSNAERAVTKIERMRSAISQLPSDMEEFNKLVKQLGNIDPKKLIEMSDLDRAQLILEKLEKPTEAQFTVWDEKTQENVFNAAGYNEAMEAYEASRLEAVNIILESADAAFTQIENRMNHAREEAEKTKTIAETLSGAIDTGELTETQKLGMSSELIQQWEQAADAPARAVIAMQQWNKYANENAAAAQELITLYGQAQKGILNATNIDISKLGDPREGKQIFENIIAQSNLMTDEIKEVWLKAWDNLAAKGVDLSGLNFMGIRAKLIEEIGQMGELTQEEMNAVTAAVTDNMAQMFQALHDQNVEQARAAADAWRDAFDLINDAKLKLLSGGSIFEMIAGDPQAIMTLAKQMGISIQELINGAMAGTLDPSKMKDFDLKEYVDAEMAAAGMFEGFGSGVKSDMAKKGYGYDEAAKTYYLQNDKGEAILGEDGKKITALARDVMGPIYETMLKALNPTATSAQISNWLDAIFASPAEYASRLVDPMSDLETATIGAGQAMNMVADQQLIEAASDVTQQEADFRGQTVKYEDLTEVQAAIQRAQQAKYAGETWDSLSQEDRDILGKYGIDFSNVDTAANQCASALAACAQAALALMEATAKQEGFYKNADGVWGKDVYTGLEERPAGWSDAQWEEHRAQNTSFVSSEALNETFNNAAKAVDNANAGVTTTDHETYEKMASSVGKTVTELEKYCDRMVEAGEITETNRMAQMNVARSMLRTSQGYDKAEKNLKDYLKTLKKVNKNSDAYDDTLNDVADIYGDVLDLSADAEKKLPASFLEGEEAARLLEEAMEGDADAYDNLQALAAKEIAIAEGAEVSDEFYAKLQEMASAVDNLEVGKRYTLGELTTVDPSFFNALVQMASASASTSSEVIANMQAMAEAMGFDIEIEEVSVPVQSSGVEYQVGDAVDTGDGGQIFISAIPNEVTDETTATAFAVKAITPRGSSGGGVRQGSGSGSGSGGGGGSSPKKKEKKKHKRYKEDTERYHKNNETLARISEELDKIDKLKDRAYGASHVDQLDKETAALQDQLHAQQALHDEALKYAAADKINVVKYGAEFDEDGTIVNYEEVMRNIVDEYNRAVDEYNNSAQEDGDKEKLEAAEERYQDAIESIANYEEAIATANAAANEMLEAQNKISEIETEKITYILEYKIEMNERDLEKLEYYQDKYDDSLAHQGEVYAAIQGEMLEYESNLAAIGEAMADLNQKRADGLINDADYAAALEELHSQIYENLGNLNEIQEKLVDTYANTLSLATEEIQETTDAIDSANSTLQSYIEIRKLIGEDDDHEKLMFLYDQMNRNNLAKIDVQKAHLNALIAEEDKFREKMRSDTYEMSDLEKEQYAALKEEIQDAREALVSSTQEALELVREIYEETINNIANELDAFMAGSAGSLAHLQEQYGYFQEEQGRYVSTAKELYEVSKLNRDIEGSLGDATSKSAKEALKALQEKINKQSELNELTEYDIEMNQLQYQLLLARIKLEETQNAKDVVRLTRDENGNYAYRYTANQDKIDEAAQNYEDILQQINDTTVQRTSEIENQMIETMAWGKEQMIAIANDYTLTEQEKRERLEELNNQFTAKMQYLQEQNNIATGNLTANQEAIAEHYGVSMSDIVGSTAGNVNETVQSMIDKTQEYIDAMNAAIFGEEGAQTAWQEYISSVGDIEAAADLAYGDMVESAEEMGEANQWSAEQAQEVIATLTSTLEPLDALTQAWNAHNAMLQETISYYETLGDTIQAALEGVGGITNTGFENPANNNSGQAKAGTTVDEVLTAGLEEVMENVAIVGGAAVGITDTDVDALEMTEYISQIQDTSLKYQEMNTELLEHIAAAIKEIANTLLNNYNFTSQGLIGGIALPSTSEILEQDVHITAEFPSVTAQSEIEEALITLMNSTAQFANRKKS